MLQSWQQVLEQLRKLGSRVEMEIGRKMEGMAGCLGAVNFGSQIAATVNFGYC
jgi:hypothetical protein